MTEERKRGVPLWPWVVLALWVMVIWGHSLMPGDESSAESQTVVRFLRNVVQLLGLEGNPTIAQVLGDPQLLHHLVRKTGHFTEYFVLGLLSFNAVKRTGARRLLARAALVGLWVSVPSIDECIQRFVPGRSGQLSDVLLDMSGFACAFVLCLIVGALLQRRHTR